MRHEKKVPINPQNFWRRTLGIKQPKTVAIFEALVTALLNSEK